MTKGGTRSQSSENAETVAIGESSIPTSDVETATELEIDAELERGRYALLGVIGRGGMGRVLRAYDPKLQREVALKLVSGSALDPAWRERMLREARAMAQLSHSNVVALYDAEESSTGVMLVMEYVAGQTLHRWVRSSRRSWSEIVARYLEAGRGLQAAHAAGLLHRDFKPANVLISIAGAVKVTDFGLAKFTSMHDSRASESFASSSGASLDGPLTHAGVVMGTPRYMPPEQHRGLPLDARVDQYAFCVSLWEALTRHAPHRARHFEDLVLEKDQGAPSWPTNAPKIPRRLVDALRRGLEPDPNERWPDMEALLTVLSYDPSQRRARGLRMLGGLGLLAALGLSWQSWIQRDAQQCSGAELELAGVWDEDRLAEARTTMDRVDAPQMERAWAHAMGELDDYADRWATMHVETCEATTLRGEQSAASMDLRMACLHRAKIELHAAATILVGADAEVARKALDVTGNLMPLARCADVDALSAEVEPPRAEDAQAVETAREFLAEAKAFRLAGRFSRAQEALGSAREGLSTVEYEPLETDVALSEGRVLERLGRYEDADEALREALRSASRWGQREAMLDAATELMFVVGYRQEREEEGLRYWELAWGLAMDDPIAEAKARSKLAVILSTQGKNDEAVAEQRRVLEIREREYGPEHRLVANALSNLATNLFNQDRFEQAEAMQRRALAIIEETMGPDHPHAATIRSSLANILLAMGRAEAALVESRQALELRDSALGSDHPEVGSAYNLVAAVLHSLGRYQEAEANFRKAIEVRLKSLSPEHPSVMETRANLGIVLAAQGKYVEAESEHRRVLEFHTKARGPRHPIVALTRNNFAVILSYQGKYAEAEAEHRRALAVQLEVLGAEHSQTLMTRANLAEDLHAQDKDVLALREYQDVLAIRRRVLPPEHPRLARSRYALAQFFFDSDDLEQALPLASAAHKRLRREDIPAEERADSAFLLAQISWETDPVRARSLAEQAEQLYRELGESKAEQVSQVITWLARQ